VRQKRKTLLERVEATVSLRTCWMILSRSTLGPAYAARVYALTAAPAPPRDPQARSRMRAKACCAGDVLKLGIGLGINVEHLALAGSSTPH
jgi:hypothetical protein